MKKTMTRLKFKITAVLMSALMTFGAFSLSSGVAFAAEGKGSADSVIPGPAYDIGLLLMENFVPGGSVIGPGIDIIVKSFDDGGPSLADISDQINELRQEISNQFADIKKQMADYKQEIEDKIVDQTVIAQKGAGFDALLTALQITDRQIKAITDDTSITDNEKAVEIAMLIGRNDQWTLDNNLYFKYQSFMNTLASPSFADQKNRDLYQVVYDDFKSQSMFSGEALNLSRPYIERVILLGMYAYSINAECLNAAKRVSEFTPEDVAGLNEDEQYNYKNVKSLTSVVDAEITAMNDRMFNVNEDDTVATHLNKYDTMNRRVYLNCGTTSVELPETIRVGNLEDVTDPGTYATVYDILFNGSLSHDDLAKIADHVRSAYPGTSLRDFLTDMGFNMADVPQDAFIPLADPEVYKAEGFIYGGGIGTKLYYDVKAISVDDTNVATSTEKCFIYAGYPDGHGEVEQLATGHVITFSNPQSGP